ATATKRPTAALVASIPAEQARRLDPAAFELDRSKQALVSELVERYADSDSPASLRARGCDGCVGADRAPRRGRAPSRDCRAVEPDTPVAGHRKALLAALAQTATAGEGGADDDDR
ncbi:MAG: hypothetical protein M3Z95_09470, partial [Actinomycetota bacterium]|nr:hypothetical protein [Actinomycetota bacterium]